MQLCNMHEYNGSVRPTTHRKLKLRVVDSLLISDESVELELSPGLHTNSVFSELVMKQRRQRWLACRRKFIIKQF